VIEGLFQPVVQEADKLRAQYQDLSPSKTLRDRIRVDNHSEMERASALIRSVYSDRTLPGVFGDSNNLAIATRKLLKSD
jgi:hypothetical protein